MRNVKKVIGSTWRANVLYLPLLADNARAHICRRAACAHAQSDVTPHLLPECLLLYVKLNDYPSFLIHTC